MTVLSTSPWKTEYSGVRQHRCSSTLDFGVERVKGTAKSSLPRKFYRIFASTYADNETYCTVLLTSQVVMIQSLQPKGREFESTCVLFLPLFDSFNFI